VKRYYKKYCTVLKRVIIEAKILYYNTQIETSTNKVKKAWEIIKDTTGKTQASEAVIKEIFSESGQITDHREIFYTNGRKSE
jgi:hypothetical protein